MNDLIRILICDDHFVVRQGLARYWFLATACKW